MKFKKNIKPRDKREKEYRPTHVCVVSYMCSMYTIVVSICNHFPLAYTSPSSPFKYNTSLSLSLSLFL